MDFTRDVHAALRMTTLVPVPALFAKCAEKDGALVDLFFESRPGAGSV